jgi:hypothetical protein
MPPTKFEPSMTASEGQETLALDLSATGIGQTNYLANKISKFVFSLK